MSREKLKLALDGVYAALEGLFPPSVVVPVVPSGPNPKLAVVSYSYPTVAAIAAVWAPIDAKAQVCILNPASGAGTTADASYVAQSGRSVAAGLMVLGYCASTYGNRTLSEALAEVTRLKLHYPKIHGVFIDEVATADTSINRSYYKQIYDKARSMGMVVVLNFGTTCPEWAMTISDIVMDCETAFANYGTKAFASWRKNYPKERFWHVVHGVSAADMPGVVDRMRTNHVGLAYVCETNAYNTLPSYFDALAAKLRA